MVVWQYHQMGRLWLVDGTSIVCLPVRVKDSALNYTNNGVFKNYSDHAEIATYFRVPQRFRQHLTLVVIRLSPDSQLRLSAPCQKCSRFLKQRGVRVIYSED